MLGLALAGAFYGFQGNARIGANYDSLINQLQVEKSSVIPSILIRMLAWKADHRPEAAALLQDSGFRLTMETENSQPHGHKRSLAILEVDQGLGKRPRIAPRHLADVPTERLAFDDQKEPETDEDMITMLAEDELSFVSLILIRMLAWDADDRPEVTLLLLDTGFASCRKAERDRDGSQKRSYPKSERVAVGGKQLRKTVQLAPRPLDVEDLGSDRSVKGWN
ncbi:uncharacterized protein KY384_003485 [Bacidia gigantensis]|uniref:uncharacterized protein n=1 Tax=Bacidia gigantensis TaxID=2732470 RepID=UPI001D049ADC|nr:uncharacterized protein KY384_003485 [Bacidia gigantensis]KAG8531849.1 hypothetical protein KY384_003485 [Bacidia gigantensis]